MFEKGHIFVYGSSGVCRVEDIRVCDYGTGKKEYYILAPVYDCRSSLSVPVDSPVFSSRARELLPEEEILKIIDSFKDSDAAWISDNKERTETFRKLLENGVCSDFAFLVRSIYLHKMELAKTGKKLRGSDESVMQRAEKLFFEEIAWVLKIEPKNIPDFIASRIG